MISSKEIKRQREMRNKMPENFYKILETSHRAEILITFALAQGSVKCLKDIKLLSKPFQLAIHFISV